VPAGTRLSYNKVFWRTNLFKRDYVRELQQRHVAIRQRRLKPFLSNYCFSALEPKKGCTIEYIF
jgi:hypothetical protein